MTKIKGLNDYYFDEDLNIISRKSGKSKVLSSRKNKRGYMIISLMPEKKVITRRVHRLIAQTFINNPKNLPQVNHKNGIKHDNRIENLEWVTSSENIKHAYDNGLKISRKGETVNTSRLTINDVLKIRDLLKEGLSMARIGKTYGVCPSAIFDIKHRITWKHVE